MSIPVAFFPVHFVSSFISCSIKNALTVTIDHLSSNPTTYPFPLWRLLYISKIAIFLKKANPKSPKDDNWKGKLERKAGPINPTFVPLKLTFLFERCTSQRDLVVRSMFFTWNWTFLDNLFPYDKNIFRNNVIINKIKYNLGSFFTFEIINFKRIL